LRTSGLTADVVLRARPLRDLASAERLQPEWSDLWSRCPHATTFQRPEWLLAWMRSFEPSHPLLIEVRRKEQLVGLAPLLIYQSGSERVLGLMGGGVSDYLDILVHPDFANEALAAIWNHIEEEPDWTSLDLTDLPSTSQLLHTLPDDFDFTKTAHDVCSGLTLPSKIEDLKNLFPFRQVRNLRNARNRLYRAGSVHIEIAARENLLSFLDTLFDLHGQRWNLAGQPGVLADPAIQSFHKTVAPQLLDRGVLRLYALRLNGRIIASLYALFERDTARCYLQGFDPEYFRLSPGVHLLGSVIADAVREGKQRIDFLRGREPYKQHWGAVESPTFRIQASRIPRLQIATRARRAA
jgi:CelD/BcsL family acetyltransferase involved in cellulose biosynthesis